MLFRFDVYLIGKATVVASSADHARRVLDAELERYGVSFLSDIEPIEGAALQHYKADLIGEIEGKR